MKSFKKIINFLLVVIIIANSIVVVCSATNYDIGETPAIGLPANSRLNTTITFDGWSTTPTSILYGSGDNDNTRAYVDTAYTDVTFCADYVSETFNLKDGRIATAPTGNKGSSFGLISSSQTFIAVEDTYNKLYQNDFIVSADMYLNVTSATLPLSLMQWVKGEDPTANAGTDGVYSFVWVKSTGEILAGNDKISTGKLVTLNDWFNISAHINYVSGNTYRISLYLDGEPIHTYTQDMDMSLANGQNAYVKFWTLNAAFKTSYMDNLHISETPDILDTTITFDGWTTTPTGFLYGSGDNDNTSAYVDTAYTDVTFAYEHIAKDSRVSNGPTDANGKNYGKAFQTSGSQTSFVAVEDIYNRLYRSNFTVSADMYMTVTAISGDVPLLMWVKGDVPTSAASTYPFVQVNKSKQLIDANGTVIGDYTLPENTWFNISANVKYLSEDTYRITLSLDGEEIHTYNYDMPVPDGASKSFIKFWSEGSINYKGSYMDNIHISENLPSALELDFNGNYTLALNRIGEDNYFTDATVQDGYLRVSHNSLTEGQKGYIVADYEKFIGFNQYLIEADFRYSGSTEYGASVATIVADNYTKTFTPVGINSGDNTLYTFINSTKNRLYNEDGKAIKVKATGEEGFTKVAILVDEGSLTYTVYVNGAVAYYKDSTELKACVLLPITFEDSGIELSVSANYAPQLRLLELHESKDNSCILDISRLLVKALPSGVSSSIIGTQTRRVYKTNSYDVRFVSGIDSLYGANVGFEITAKYEDKQGSQTKELDLYSNLVFSRIEADDRYVYAYELGCDYLATLQVVDIPMETTVTFTATPYVNHGGIKIYGDAFSETFYAGEVTDEPDDEYDIEFDENQVEGVRNYAFNYTFDNVASLDAEATEGFELSYNNSYPFELVADADGYITNTNEDGHIMIEDTEGALNGKSFIVEAEITFTSLPVSKDNGQYPIRVLRWIRAGEDQGTSYNHADEAFRIDADGKVYFSSTTEPTDFVLKANEKYTIKAYYTKDGQLKLLINGDIIGTKKFLTHDTISSSHLCLMDVNRATFDVNIHSFCAYYSDMSQFLPDATCSLSDAVSKVTTDTVYFEAYTGKDALSYEVGEEINMEVYLMANGEVVSVPYFYYTIEGEDGKEKTEAYVDGSKGHFSVTTSMSKEGHALVTAYMCDEDKNIINAGIVFRGGAIVGVSDITTAGTIPTDLEEYWSNVVAECYADETINLVRFDEISAEDYSYDDSVYKLYLFEIGYDDGKIATGYISYPIGKDSLGIRMRFRGYGHKGVATPQFSETEVYIDMAPHGFSLVDENPEYPDENYGFDETENQDPDTVYFHEMFTRNILGARFLKAFAGGTDYGTIMYNGEQIQPLGVWEKGDYFLASGGSQGGFQAMAVGALDNDVTDIYMGAPWFSDIGGQNIGRFPGTLKPAYTDALMYYDCSSLATLVDTDVTAILTAGLGDRICPPSGIITVYNALNCKKSISVTQNGDHAYTPPVTMVYILKNH